MIALKGEHDFLPPIPSLLQFFFSGYPSFEYTIHPAETDILRRTFPFIESDMTGDSTPKYLKTFVAAYYGNNKHSKYLGSNSSQSHADEHTPTPFSDVDIQEAQVRQHALTILNVSGVTYSN